MLMTLRIKNIAVIDETEIAFEKGLNILSGETGAGKSVAIQSISLLLGSRASADLLRSGCDEASVEGVFDVSQISWMEERLKKAGFPHESSELLIKRVVHRSGKNRIYVNGELATLAILQELCAGLVDLCGQHEHQSLTRSEVQLDLLDRYGGLAEKVENFSGIFSNYRSLSKEKMALEQAESERIRKADFLKFQVDELRRADLHAGEDQDLQQEKMLLQSAETRLAHAQAAIECLDAEESGVLEGLRAGLSKLKNLQALDFEAEAIREGWERALAEAEEANAQLLRYVRGIELDPGRLQEVLERLALLADLKKKYGPTVAEMIQTLGQLEREWGEMDNAGDRLKQIEEDLSQVTDELAAQARLLTQARKQIAKTLSQSVTAELKELKMADAALKILVEDHEERSAWSEKGSNHVVFEIQTNRGEESKPIGKVASGGELSRLMLAIRRVISDRGGIGVYLFDEIDAGMGGQTAFQVGKKLKSVSQYNQVICITHLPQVASFADHHLSVRKKIKGNRTVTEIAELDTQERKQEIARMLGGSELTSKSLANAAELIQMAGQTL